MDEVAKPDRLRYLKRIIQDKEIKDQVQLLNELKKRGIKTTQATVSRDLQELGVVKVRTRPGAFKYELTEKVPQGLIFEKLKVLFNNFVVNVKSANNLILIKTTPGNANGVAELVDRLGRKDILGTIAGDDTILIIVNTKKGRAVVEQLFISLFGGK